MIHDRKGPIAALGIICLTVLLALGKADSDIVVPGITGIVMYILGNGVAARSGQDVQPIIRPREIEDRRAPVAIEPATDDT